MSWESPGGEVEATRRRGGGHPALDGTVATQGDSIRESEEIFTAKTPRRIEVLKRNAEGGENAEEDAESLIAWRSWRLGGSYSTRQWR